MTPRRLGVAVALLAGLAAQALQGGMLAWVTLIAAVICGAAPWLRGLLERLPWAVVTGLCVVGLVACGVAGLAPNALLGALLAYLQVHRRLTRRDAADDRVTLLLAALMLVAAAGTASTPLYLVLGVAWAFALPVALQPEGAMAWRGAAATTGAATAVAVALFLAAPRPAPRALAGESVELTGFSPDVQLGTMDVLLEDPAVVFRATVQPEPTGPMYWRGIALDYFDGQRWRSTTPPVPAELQAPGTYPGDAVGIRVVLVPTPEGVLFTAGRPLSLDVEGATLRADVQGGWFSSGGGRLTYSMMSLGPLGAGRLFPPEGDPEALFRSLRLPDGLDPRIRRMAQDIAGDGDPELQVARLVDHLRADYTYTRRPADDGSEGPLASFLFEGRAGHCEYFASALAILARSRGIPARVVNGFVGGERNPTTGWWVVRRYHAHSWVEVHYDNVGWVVVDATPGPGAPVAEPDFVERWSDALDTWWVNGFLAYDQADQSRAVLSAGRVAEAWMPATPTPSELPWRGFLILATVWIGSTLVVRWGAQRAIDQWLGSTDRPPRGPVARAHHRARLHVRGLGIVIPAALPPVAAAHHLQRLHPGEAADALLELAWLYYDVRLGGASGAVHAAQARALRVRVEQLTVSDTVTPAA